MKLPVLPGFVVSRMVLDDAPAWAGFALRPEMLRFTSSNAASVDDLLPMIERNLSTDPAAPVLFAVRDAVSGEFVANGGFHTISALNRTAELTYSVRPERWGQGLATALCGALVGWGFNERGWVRIQATTLVEHEASQRVLHKCGFALEGRVRNFRMVRGQPRDYLLFARVPAAD